MSEPEFEGKSDAQVRVIQTAYDMARAQMACGQRTRAECIDDFHKGAKKAAEVADRLLSAARMLLADRESDFDHSVCVPLDFGALRKEATDATEKTVRRRRPMRP